MNFLIDVDLKDIKILSHTDGESKMTKLFFKLKFPIFTKIIDSFFYFRVVNFLSTTNILISCLRRC